MQHVQRPADQAETLRAHGRPRLHAQSHDMSSERHNIPLERLRRVKILLLARQHPTSGIGWTACQHEYEGAGWMADAKLTVPGRQKSRQACPQWYATH
jgi:hypothetical protein